MLKQNFIAVLVGLFSVDLYAQTLITDVTATASSEHHPTVYSAMHAVNGNGLYLGSYPNQIHHGGGHSGVGNSNEMIWLSEEPSDEWFKVDLGDRYAVETLRIWNGSFRGAIDTDSIKDVDIYYSTELSDPGSNFTDPNSSWKLFGSHTFAINPVGNPSTNDYAKTEELELGGIDARWIALDIKNNYGFDNWVSIGELQFDGSIIPDTDDDGVYDPYDAFPLDPSESLDTDGDLIGNNTDTDDDGDSLSDIKENTFGSDPLVPDTYSSLIAIINTTDYSNMLTLDEVKDLRAGSTMIEVESGQATLSMQVEQSDDLGIWTNGGASTLQIPIDAEAGKKFFRFRMAE